MAVHANDFDQLVEVFLDRVRMGDSITVEQFANDHAEYACDLRDLLPTIVALEECAVDSADIVPDQIGDYTIRSVLGRGGMAIVYRATQTSLNREVALKVLPVRKFESKSTQARFQREAQAAARLHHENIVPIYEVGAVADAQFYSMQLIHGWTLHQCISDMRNFGSAVDVVTNAQSTLRMNGSATVGDTTQPEKNGPATALIEVREAPVRVPIPEPFSSEHYEFVAKIGLQIASALQQAHDMGIVHRDVKPSNIMIDESGKGWITDFGLAKTPDASITGSGVILGTLRYMSPEQYQGNATTSSDVYSLGLTLFELATLAPAHKFDRPSDLQDIAEGNTPVSLKTSAGQIPRNLETIILNAIAVRPSDRIPSAEHLAADLKRFLDGKPVESRRPSLYRRIREGIDRHPVRFVVTAMLLAVAIAAFAAFELGAYFYATP